MGEQTFSVSLESTKSLGRGNSVTLTFNSPFPSARFMTINRTHNPEWTSLEIVKWTVNNIVLHYYNDYTDTLTGNIIVAVYGVDTD